MVPKLKGKHWITTTASSDDWLHELFPKEAQHQVLHSKVRNGNSQILTDNVPEPAKLQKNPEHKFILFVSFGKSFGRSA